MSLQAGKVEPGSVGTVEEGSSTSVEEIIGHVLRFFPKWGAVGIDLTGTLKRGDGIVIRRKDGSECLSGRVESMHQNWKPIPEAEAGCAVGIKVEVPIDPKTERFDTAFVPRPGFHVFRVLDPQLSPASSSG